MSPPSVSPHESHARQGLIFGLLGVLTFSLTLPFSRMAVASLDPLVVGLGRALVAALLAAPLLYFKRQPLPTRSQWVRLFVVGLGVIVGFPWLSTWAMQRIPASHGAVVTGLLPMATAIFGVVRSHERPSWMFWLAGAIGSATVITFAISSGGGQLHPADVALLGAVLAAAVGYAEGAFLARELGGWQVICWALVLMFPILLGPVLWQAAKTGLHGTPMAWVGFGYVSIFSMFLGFFAWYHGLAVGGVARVSQLQLLQPFFTLGFSAVLLKEHLRPAGLVAAAIVASSIFLGRRAVINSKQITVKVGQSPD